MFDDLITFLSDNDGIKYVYNCMAVLAFVGCAALYALSFFRARRKIIFSVIDYRKSFGHICSFFVYIHNQSSLPLCIKSISIYQNGKLYRCELVPKLIRGQGECLLKSPAFPLNLSAKEGGMYFLEFLFCEDIELDRGKKVDFQVHTNRGVIKLNAVLGNISYYLHTREEFLKTQQEEIHG